MILLILCIGANIILAHIFKTFTKHGVDNLNAIIVNYFMCVVVSSLVLGYLSVPLDLFSRPWFWLAIALASMFITGFNIMALSYQKAGVSLTVIIQKMSLIIPVAFAVAYYDEQLNIYKIIGILCALAAIVLSNLPEKGSEATLSFRSPVVMLPLVTMIMSGVIEIMLYYSEASGLVTDDGAEFTASCFFLAGAFGIVFAIYRYFTQGVAPGFKELVGGVALGIPNYFSIYLIILLLARGWDGAVLFPLNNIGILIAGTILGIVAYRESIHRNKVVGIVLGGLAILFIGILGA